MGVFTKVSQPYLRTQQVTIHGTFTFSGSYPTGGEECDPGLAEIHKATIDQGVEGMMFEYDYANRKIKAYTFPADAGVAVQLANESPALDGAVVRVSFDGR